MIFQFEMFVFPKFLDRLKFYMKYNFTHDSYSNQKKLKKTLTNQQKEKNKVRQLNLVIKFNQTISSINLINSINLKLSKEYQNMHKINNIKKFFLLYFNNGNKQTSFIEF